MPVVDAERARPSRTPSLGVDRGGFPPAGRPPSGGWDRGPEPGAARSLSNARLGMFMLLCGESVFFGGLVAACLHLRLSADVWPPPGQPRLPVGLTALNTLVLLASSVTLSRALGALRAGDGRALVRGLARTLGLGAVFLAVQGLEWIRLVRFGLTMSSGAYGATFYTLIGVHGAHVLGAVTWLVLVLWAATRGRYRPERHVGLATCAIYWHFVVALWPVLYVLVYLA